MHIDTGREGNLATLLPDDEAQEWIDEHVESEGWQWLGRSLVIDVRFAENLLAGFIEDGGSVT